MKQPDLFDQLGQSVQAEEAERRPARTITAIIPPRTEHMPDELVAARTIRMTVDGVPLLAPHPQIVLLDDVAIDLGLAEPDEGDACEHEVLSNPEHCSLGTGVVPPPAKATAPAPFGLLAPHWCEPCRRRCPGRDPTTGFCQLTLEAGKPRLTMYGYAKDAAEWEIVFNGEVIPMDQVWWAGVGILQRLVKHEDARDTTECVRGELSILRRRTPEDEVRDA